VRTVHRADPSSQVHALTSLFGATSRSTPVSARDVVQVVVDLRCGEQIRDQSRRWA
jgi:hypothetical protein